MAIKFEDDGGKPRPALKPQSAKVSGEGQSATTADDSSSGKPEALPFGKPARPDKKGAKSRNK